MAEIKIEKKKPIWPWLLLLLLIGGIATFFLLEDDEYEAEARGIYDVENVAVNADADADVMGDYGDEGALKDYYMYVDNDFKAYTDNEDMGLDHKYTHNALNRLTAAMWAKASQLNYNIEADLGTVRDNADRIQKDPYDTNHADLIRESFEKIAMSMNNMQDAKFPDMDTEVDELMEMAKDLNPEELTLDQKREVKGFFDKAASILMKMD